MIFSNKDLNEAFQFSKKKRANLREQLIACDLKLRKNPKPGKKRFRLKSSKDKLETLIKIVNQSLLLIIAHSLKVITNGKEKRKGFKGQSQEK